MRCSATVALIISLSSAASFAAAENVDVNREDELVAASWSVMRPPDGDQYRWARALRNYVRVYLPTAELGYGRSRRLEALGRAKTSTLDAGLLAVHQLRTTAGNTRFSKLLRDALRGPIDAMTPHSDDEVWELIETTTPTADRNSYDYLLDGGRIDGVLEQIAHYSKDGSAHRLVLAMRLSPSSTKLAMPVEVTTTGGTVRLTLPADGKPLTVPLDHAPTAVALDPDFHSPLQPSPRRAPVGIVDALEKQNALFVLPSAAGSKAATAFSSIRDKLCPTCATVSDDDVVRLPDDKAVVIMGYSNVLRGSVAAAATEAGGFYDDVTTRAGGLRLSNATTSVVAAMRNPASHDHALLFVGLDSFDRIAAVVDAIAELSTYSLVAIDDSGSQGFDWLPRRRHSISLVRSGAYQPSRPVLDSRTTWATSHPTTTTQQLACGGANTCGRMVASRQVNNSSVAVLITATTGDTAAVGHAQNMLDRFAFGTSHGAVLVEIPDDSEQAVTLPALGRLRLWIHLQTAPKAMPGRVHVEGVGNGKHLMKALQHAVSQTGLSLSTTRHALSLPSLQVDATSKLVVHARFPHDGAGQTELDDFSARLSTVALDERFAVAMASREPKSMAFRSVETGAIIDYRFSGPGARIHSLVHDSPAARAGLKPGDVIVQAGKPDEEPYAVRDHRRFAAILGRFAPGDTVHVVYRRNTQESEATLTLVAPADL